MRIMKDITTRNKIVIATINCIEIYGIEGCTIRYIAKEAEVNLSSVHYYFESKDELVATSLNQSISHSFEDIDQILVESGTNYKAALTRVLVYLFDGAIQYPGITRAGLQSLLMHGETDGLFTIKLNGFLGKISKEISMQYNMDLNSVRLKLISIFSTILFLGVSKEAYKDFSTLSFQDKENRALIVKNMIDDCFKDS
jgi:AcrR family transcriptional regulator